MNSPTTPLEQALQLTRGMLAAARAHEWDRLILLEARREPLLRRQHGTDATCREQIGEILACDRELQALVGCARHAVAEQWQVEDGRRRAIVAYRLA